MLTWRYNGESLVIKAPSHAAHLDSLFRVFPDARVLWTHRDPVQVVSSFCNLCELIRRIRSDDVDPREIGASTKAGLLGLIMRANHTGPTRDCRRTSPERYGIAEVDIRDLYAEYTRRFASSASH